MLPHLLLLSICFVCFIRNSRSSSQGLQGENWPSFRTAPLPSPPALLSLPPKHSQLPRQGSEMLIETFSHQNPSVFSSLLSYDPRIMWLTRPSVSPPICPGSSCVFLLIAQYTPAMLTFRRFCFDTARAVCFSQPPHSPNSSFSFTVSLDLYCFFILRFSVLRPFVL